MSITGTIPSGLQGRPEIIKSTYLVNERAIDMPKNKEQTLKTEAIISLFS